MSTLQPGSGSDPDAPDPELRPVFVAARRRAAAQVTALQRSFDQIVEAAELSSTDDEHDPEGATIAYERAQVSALLAQAREDVAALDRALETLGDGTSITCERCGRPIGVERLTALPTTRRCVGCAS